MNEIMCDPEFPAHAMEFLNSIALWVENEFGSDLENEFPDLADAVSTLVFESNAFLEEMEREY